jgi:molybdopterin molybdotransferase
MLLYEQALDKIKNVLKVLPKETEKVELINSIGRILAEDIIADINLPPFNNSAMDGYAIKFNPLIKKWNVIGEMPAGANNYFDLNDDSAVSVMTGAKLPSGADTVIPIEKIIAENNEIKISNDTKISQGMNTRLIGEDLLLGSVAIKKGTLIKSNNISIAAACGKSNIKVYRRLNIGVLTTGNELVPIDEKPNDAQIRSSNLASIIASIKEMNMNPIDFGFCKDIKEEIKTNIYKAFNSDIDLLVTTGSVSVGKYDFIQEILKELGAEIIFWKVKIKPGKPFLLSTYRKEDKIIPIFSLPGNPLSSYVNFRLFVKNPLLQYFGVESTKIFQAKLKSRIKKSDERMHFILGTLSFDSFTKHFIVESAGSQSSGTMSTLSNADCMFVFPSELTEMNEGEWVECLMI